MGDLVVERVDCWRMGDLDREVAGEGCVVKTFPLKFLLLGAPDMWGRAADLTNGQSRLRRLSPKKPMFKRIRILLRLTNCALKSKVVCAQWSKVSPISFFLSDEHSPQHINHKPPRTSSKSDKMARRPARCYRYCKNKVRMPFVARHSAAPWRRIACLAPQMENEVTKLEQEHTRHRRSVNDGR